MSSKRRAARMARMHAAAQTKPSAQPATPSQAAPSSQTAQPTPAAHDAQVSAKPAPSPSVPVSPQESVEPAATASTQPQGDSADDTPLERRFPQLADLDDMDYGQRIETFQHVLDTLQHDLDEERD